MIFALKKYFGIKEVVNLLIQYFDKVCFLLFSTPQNELNSEYRRLPVSVMWKSSNRS